LHLFIYQGDVFNTEFSCSFQFNVYARPSWLPGRLIQVHTIVYRQLTSKRISAGKVDSYCMCPGASSTGRHL